MHAGWPNKMALLVAQKDFTEQGLMPRLKAWLSDKTELQQMAARARACALDDVTAQVVALSQQAISHQMAGQHL